MDDKPIIPVLSRRIMSVYDEKPEPAGGFIWAIIAGGRIWPTEYIVSSTDVPCIRTKSKLRESQPLYIRMEFLKIRL